MRLLRILHTVFPSVHAGAYLLIGANLVALGIALLRDRAFAYMLGPSETFDLYIAAFRIPDVLFVVLTAMVSVVAVLPILEEKRHASERTMYAYFGTLFSCFLVGLLILAAIAVVVMPMLVESFFAHFSSEAQQTLTLLSRVLVVQAVLLGVSNFFSIVVQMHRRFLTYALSPILYNMGIIVGVLVLFPVYGTVGLAYGVVLGAIAHLGIQVSALHASEVFKKLTFVKTELYSCLRTAAVSLPRGIAMLSHTVAHSVAAIFIVRLGEGMLSMFHLADNVRFVPIATIGVAYSIAVFPELARRSVEGGAHFVRSRLEESLQHVLFLLIPTTVLLFFFREDVVYLLFETGAFGADATRMTALLLGAVLPGVFGLSFMMLCARAYYASGLSVLPVSVSCITAVVKVVAVYYLVTYHAWVTTILEPLLGRTITPETLLIIFALTMGGIEVIGGLVLLSAAFRRFRLGREALWRGVVQHVIAGLALLLALYAGSVVLQAGITGGEESIVLYLGVIGVTAVLGLSAWLGTLRALKNPEYALWREKLRKVL